MGKGGTWVFGMHEKQNGNVGGKNHNYVQFMGEMDS